MDTIVQWATILSPIIAVVIAIWASRSSEKNTAKKLVALEESTTKQVEGVKELTKIQIEVTKIQLQKDLWEARQHYSQISQRVEDERRRDHFNNWVSGTDSFYQREDRKKDLSDNYDFLSKQIDVLNKLVRQVDVMSKNVGGE